MKEKIQNFLKKFSFKTGVIVLALCIPCYIISFAQMAIPSLSAGTKSVLWVIFFGLAKTFQYGGLTILGVEGWNRLKAYFKKKKDNNNHTDNTDNTDSPQIKE